MAILVVCPGCKKSFNVDDKFAGKTGPCPKCKTKITIPEKQAEVKIHTPDEFGGGGKSVTGKLLLKPIARQQTRIKPLAAVLIGGSVVAAIAWAIAVRVLTPAAGTSSSFYLYFGAIGVLLISPPLTLAGYTFLRDDETEPYRGKELCVRAAICGLVYMVLWAIFAYVKSVLTADGSTIELPYWLLIAPPFFLVGTVAGKFSFDLETGNGFFHYAFYAAVAIVLAWIAGFGWAWQ